MRVYKRNNCQGSKQALLSEYMKYPYDSLYKYKKKHWYLDILNILYIFNAIIIILTAYTKLIAFLILATPMSFYQCDVDCTYIGSELVVYCNVWNGNKKQYCSLIFI